MERISGPYKGHFIAAYTVETGNRFVGYAKVCLKQPDSVWNTRSVEKLTSAAGFETELKALTAAEKKARQAIVHIVDQTGPITASGSLR